MKRILVLIVTMALGSEALSFAQKFSISTDLLGYACLGTMNADMSLAVSRKWSLTLGARYNPFTFNKGDTAAQFQLRQRSGSLGVRLWPWHTGSGWWLAGKVRYQEYNMGGILSPEVREGERYGAGLYAGYTHMLSSHFNLEFGAGLWGGMDDFNRYSCGVCGVTLESGRGPFVLPDDIMVSLVYVF